MRKKGEVYGREGKKKKSSTLEVELVLQSMLSLCTEWKRRRGGEGFGQKPRSLILIKKHREHQRPTQNLYQSGAPTIAMILKLPGAIQCQVLRQAQGLG